jgi:hypothetical protein
MNSCHGFIVPGKFSFEDDRSFDAVSDGAARLELKWRAAAISPGSVPARKIGQLGSAMNDLACHLEQRSLISQRSHDRIQGHLPKVCADGFIRASLSCRVRPYA